MSLPHKNNSSSGMGRREIRRTAHGGAMSATQQRTVSQLPKRQERKHGKWIGRDKVFDCQLRELREKHGLTLRDVAKHSGVSVATIARAEWGAELCLSQALKLAHFFEYGIEQIWTRRRP